MPSSPDKKVGVILSCKELGTAFDLIPAQCIGGDKWMEYYPQKFRLAPNWVAAKKYVPCLAKVLAMTDGRQVLQTAMFAALQTWADTHDMQPTEKQLVKASYGLRAIISQLANHLKRDRVVPRQHRQAFFPLTSRLCGDGEELIVLLWGGRVWGGVEMLLSR